MSKKAQQKNYSYEQTMPNFFAVKNDTIEFRFDGELYRVCVIKNGSRNGSIATAIESGLNHWLSYWYHTNEDMYDEICESLFDTYNRIFNYIADIKSKSKSVYDSRLDMIYKYCFPTKFIADSFIHYIIDLTVCNIDESKASTKVTVTNDMATVFAVYAYYFKYLEIFAEMSPDRKFKLDEASGKEWCMICEKLTYKCCMDIINFKCDNEDLMNKMKEIFGVNSMDELEAGDLQNPIYDFMASRSIENWNKSATSAFDNKYKEVGYDGNWTERTAVGSVFNACKKYSPPLKDKSLIPKYTSKPTFRDIPSKEIKVSGMRYVIGYDYSDFMFVTMQVTSYLQKCLGNTNSTSITKQSIANVNVNNIMNADSEAIKRQEMSLLEDNKNALYDMRIDNSQTLFKEIAEELKVAVRKTNITNILDFAKEFDISKSHRLNAYILAKIFLSLTGERDIYRDIYGTHAKLFLALFYIKMMSSNNYSQYKDIVECMRMCPSVITGDAHKLIIDRFIEHYGLHEDLSGPFQNICRGYSSGDVTRGIEVEHFYEFFTFMSNPYNVRFIMCPSVYKSDVVSDNIKLETPYKEVIDECLKHIS